MSTAPRRPLVYLDQSTLSDAFRAEVPEGRQLRGWVEATAPRVDLCVSLVHFLEAAPMPAANGDAFATWIESLPFRWTRSYRLVEPLEDDYWTSVVAGVTSPTPVDVLAPSLVAAFSGLKPGEAERIGARAWSLADVVDAARQDVRADRHAEIAALARVVRADAADVAAQGVPEAARLARVGDKLRAAVRRKALDAARRLEGSPAFAATGATRGSVQDLLVDEMARNPRALPLWRVRQAMTSAFRALVLRLDEGSTRDTKLLGDVLDAEHAGVGAAYCDVFTCDRANALTIAPVRAALGFDLPIALLRKGRADFLRRLKDAVERELARPRS